MKISLGFAVASVDGAGEIARTAEKLERVGTLPELLDARRLRLMALGGSFRREDGDWLTNEPFCPRERAEGLIETCSFGGVTGLVPSDMVWDEGAEKGEKWRWSESALREGRRVMRGLKRLFSPHVTTEKKWVTYGVGANIEVAGTGGGSIEPTSILLEGLLAFGVKSTSGGSSGSRASTLADFGVERLDDTVASRGAEAVSSDAVELMVIAIAGPFRGPEDCQMIAWWKLE